MGVGLLVLSLLVWFPFAVEPMGRDQGAFLTEAALWMDGQALYTDIWEHKSPGLILIYRAALSVMGRGYEAVQTIDWLAGLSTACLLAFALIRARWGLAAVTFSCVAYLVFKGGLAFGGWWSTGQAEIFLDPLVAGVLLLLILRAHSARALLGLGALLGCAFLVKYSAAVLGLVALVPLVRMRREGEAWGRATLLIVLGGLAPLVLTLGYFAATGAVGDLFEATFSFNASHRQLAGGSVWPLKFRRIAYAWKLLTPLYLLAVPGLILAVTQRQRAQDQVAPVAGVAMLLLGVGLGQVFLQAKFWVYHYHVVLLPLCVLAGLGLNELVLASRRWGRLGRGPALVVAVMLAIGLATVPYARRMGAYLDEHLLLAFWTGAVDEEQMLATYRWGATDYDYTETLAAARAIAAETSPGDPIFVWGFEPGVYFLAERPNASRFLYDYPLMPLFANHHEGHVDDLMADLTARPPVRILIVDRDQNDLEERTSWEQLAALDVLRTFVEGRYQVAWTRGDFTCLRPAR